MRGGSVICNSSIEIATLEDIRPIASIHCSALPDDVLPGLGEEFLEKHFYNKCLASDGSSILVVRNHGTIIGFVLIGKELPILKLFSFSFLGYAFRLLAKNPRNVLRAAVSTFCKKKKYAADLEIIVFAVRPDVQSKGVGTYLLGEILKRYQGSRIVVKTSSERSKKFYERCGFCPCGIEHRGARRFYVLLAG